MAFIFFIPLNIHSMNVAFIEIKVQKLSENEFDIKSYLQISKYINLDFKDKYLIRRSIEIFESLLKQQSNKRSINIEYPKNLAKYEKEYFLLQSFELIDNLSISQSIIDFINSIRISEFKTMQIDLSPFLKLNRV